MHKHKCNHCGNIWQHDESCAGNQQAHTCEACNHEQWNRHYANPGEQISVFLEVLFGPEEPHHQ